MSNIEYVILIFLRKLSEAEKIRFEMTFNRSDFQFESWGEKACVWLRSDG